MKLKRTLMSILAVMMLCTAVCYAEGGSEGPSFQKGDYIQMGTYNGAPLLWRYTSFDIYRRSYYKTLADRDMKSRSQIEDILYSDQILCFKSYDVPDKDGALSNSWDEASLREWLNSTAERDAAYDEKGFLGEGNFTRDERNAMKKTDVPFYLPRWKIPEDMKKDAFENIYSFAHFYGNEYRDMYGVADFEKMDVGVYDVVKDKIFLMDEQLVFDIFANNYTAAASLADPMKPAYEREGYNHPYWIRSPYNGELRGFNKDTLPVSDVCVISGEDEERPFARQISNSLVSFISEICGDKYTHRQVDEAKGVRPAFYLDRENAVVVSGTGTKEDPYILTGKPGIVVMLNGVEQSYEQKPIEKDGQVLVPLRAVFESLGAEVGWEEGTQMVTVTKDKEQVKIQVGSKVMEKNGEEIDFGYPAVLEGGRTMIPLSAVSESFSIPVDWNRDEQRIDITAETETE